MCAKKWDFQNSKAFIKKQYGLPVETNRKKGGRQPKQIDGKMQPIKSLL